MKYAVPSLLLCLPLAALPLGEADAAAWRWSQTSGREQITIVPDVPPTRADTRRTGEQTLTLTLTPPPQHLELQGAGPGAQALFSGLSLDNGELRLSTSSAAFGFIAAPPTAEGVVIVLYPDPLGLRWRPGGELAPMPPVAASSPSAGDAPSSSVPQISGPSSPPSATAASSASSSAPAPSEAPSSAAPSNPSGTERPSSTVPDTASPVAATATEAPETISPPSVSEPQTAALPSVPPVTAQEAPSAPHTPSTSDLPEHVVSSPEPSNAVSAGSPEKAIAQRDADPEAPVAEPAQEASVSELEAPHSQALSPAPENASPASLSPASSVPAAVSSAPAAIPTVRGRLNRGGPETWPEDQALSSVPTPSTPIEPFSEASPPPVPPSVSSGSQQILSTSVSDSTATGDPVAEGKTPTVPPSASPEAEISVVETSAPTEQVPSQTGKLATQLSEYQEEAPAGTNGETERKTPEQEQAAETLPIYVDEEGNPVPPPPDVPALQAAMRDAMKDGRYQDVLPSVQTLRQVELSREDREEMLYNAMTALYETTRPNFTAYTQDLINAANEAMNFNLESPRVPDALAVLATVNLALGNVEDARGYVQLMRRKYPANVQVPASLLELGAKQMERQEYAEATLTFQTILQDYPDSPLAKDAARLETYALYRQGHTDRALTLVDFVERRWPRLYLEDPDYLAVSADIRFRQGHLEDALRTYWTQYNLDPAAPESASTLYHIAEVYYLLHNPDAAAKVLDELVRAFPLSAEAPAALLRLGENGIHKDNPTVDELFAVYEAPNPRLPGLYYQRIIKEYPQSPEFMTAQLRTTVWQLWNKEYYPAMTAARSFLIDYADKPESLRARTVLLRGFAHELALSLEEENYERVLRLWDDFPQVHDEYLPLEPDMRMALARAHLNRGNEQEGLELLSAFLDGPGDTDAALYTYNLFLATYLRQQNWDAILTLGEKVAAWPLPEEARNQLDYALALSAENLGLQGRALPLWRKLADRTDIPLYQRAYATYFLARDAENRQDLRDAYQYNLDTLGMFTQLQDEQSPYADQERIRESIAALMDVTEIAGRYAEALEWANRYALFVPENSPDYAGLQFREAGLHRKMGDMARWRALLQGIVDREPDSVFGKMAASELRTQDVARDLTRFTGN